MSRSGIGQPGSSCVLTLTLFGAGAGLVHATESAAESHNAPNALG